MVATVLTSISGSDITLTAIIDAIAGPAAALRAVTLVRSVRSDDPAANLNAAIAAARQDESMLGGMITVAAAASTMLFANFLTPVYAMGQLLARFYPTQLQVAPGAIMGN